MNKTIYIVIFLFSFIRISLGQDTKSTLEKEYSNFEKNPRISKLEDTLNVKLNSLAKVLKHGEYCSFDNLELYQQRIFELSKKHYEDNKGLFLTWGTNGYCGREGEWFDSLTSKYGFKYVGVSCSCIVMHIPDLVTSYNTYATQFLNRKHGKSWSKQLEKEILQKKRKTQ